MIHKLYAHKKFKWSYVYHTVFKEYLNIGDVVIMDMDGDIVAVKVVSGNIRCYDCPFNKNRTCTVRNTHLDAIMCRRPDDTYVSFESFDNILENL